MNEYEKLTQAIKLIKEISPDLRNSMISSLMCDKIISFENIMQGYNRMKEIELNEEKQHSCILSNYLCHAYYAKKKDYIRDLSAGMLYQTQQGCLNCTEESIQERSKKNEEEFEEMKKNLDDYKEQIKSIYSE